MPLSVPSMGLLYPTRLSSYRNAYPHCRLANQISENYTDDQPPKKSPKSSIDTMVAFIKFAMLLNLAFTSVQAHPGHRRFIFQSLTNAEFLHHPTHT